MAGEATPFSKQPNAKPAFKDAGGGNYDYTLKVKTNISLLIERLKKYETKESVNTADAEKDIRKKFREFLIGCEFHMALSDFKDALNESRKKPRDDGSTGWHHQLSQIQLFLSLIEEGDISLDQLEKYGGLETAIRTALRHDSIEDFGVSFKQFEDMQKSRIQQRYKELNFLGIKGIDDDWRRKEHKNLKILVNNLRLMTKKVAILDKEGNPQYYADGRMKKRSLFKNTMAYIQNMLSKKNASPVVWILKTFDGTHNLSTMLDAPKFIAKRRLKYCNEREDMYGGRKSLPEKAASKWPDFAEAIKKVDDLMGAILYTNIGYLEHVDQDAAYPDDEAKHRDGDPIYVSGVDKYVEGALSFNMPRGLNPFFTLLDSIHQKTLDKSNLKIQKRTELFWEYSLKPALVKFENNFPEIFKASNDNKSSGSPNGSARAPQML